MRLTASCSVRPIRRQPVALNKKQYISSKRPPKLVHFSFFISFLLRQYVEPFRQLHLHLLLVLFFVSFFIKKKKNACSRHLFMYIHSSHYPYKMKARNKKYTFYFTLMYLPQSPLNGQYTSLFILILNVVILHIGGHFSGSNSTCETVNHL